MHVIICKQILTVTAMRGGTDGWTDATKYTKFLASRLMIKNKKCTEDTVYSKRNAHLIPNFCVAPLPLGGATKNSEINVHFFWNRL